MNYTEESRISDSKEEGQWGELHFSGWMDGWCIGRYEEIGNRCGGYSPGIQSLATQFYGKPKLILDCSTNDDSHVLDCHQ